MSLELQITFGFALLLWGGIPWSRFIKDQRGVMALHVLKGLTPVALVRVGLLEGWSGSVSQEVLAWGVGFLTVFMHALSIFRKGAPARAIGVTAGALVALQPIGCLAGLLCAGIAWQLKKETPERAAWAEVAGILGAAAGVMTVSHWSEALWIGAIWWILLLQRQEQNLERILNAQDRSARS